MFSELFFLQILTFIILYLLFTSKETFYILTNCLLFLAVSSLFMWAKDADVYANFLVIIDLGVFLILLAFLLNLTRIFQTPHSTSSVRSVPYLIIVSWSSLILFLMCAFFSFSAEIKSFSNNLSPMSPSYYDWYSLYSFTFFSDLQLLSEIYFHANFYEFVLMNIFLYASLLLVTLILNITYPKTLAPLHTYLLLLQRKFEKQVFQRVQKLQSQIKRTATVRAWNTSLADGYDSTSNLSTSNR